MLTVIYDEVYTKYISVHEKKIFFKELKYAKS